MKGSQQVLACLNQLLTGELSAADQYFVHAHLCRNWGFNKLFERIDHERRDELEHARQLIERILFLEGTPNVAERLPLKIGADVPKILKSDLALELEVVANLKAAVRLCESEQDYETRRFLVNILEDTEEDHAHWLEIQLGLIGKMGLENYLQSAAGDIAAHSAS